MRASLLRGEKWCELRLPLPKEGGSRGMAFAPQSGIPPRLRRDSLPSEGGENRHGAGAAEGKLP
ncbi:MAG: hypothetical protein OJF61_001164 [Rhodanobacteraceae bacterium]|nr:MAG: hypothetical protein OJF61_001164 [Rhodanobacteraceae bacterium]